MQQFGIAYYRIKINNSNGTYNYSPTVLFDNKCNETDNMQIYPNPVVDNENITLRFTTLYTGEANLIIFNSFGQLVLKKSIQVRQGINLITPNIKNLIPEKYSIKLMGSNGEQISAGKQFIKQ